MDRLAHIGGGLDAAVIIGLLEVKTGHRVVQQRPEGLLVGKAVFHGDGLYLHTVSETIGLDGLKDHGMGSGGDQHGIPLPRMI